MLTNLEQLKIIQISVARGFIMKSLINKIKQYLERRKILRRLKQVENLNKAIQLLEEKLSVKLIKSTVLETEPVGFKSNDNFLNQVVSMEDCDYSPEELLDICQGIEVELGRAPHSIQFNKDGSRAYSSRVIDIDILL